jgi:heptosyltransferase-2
VIRRDCRYYKGDIPCIYHKKSGAICEVCENYLPLEGRILIIKLGAGGDVIRTTPLLRKLREVYPNYEISWLTYFGDFLSEKWVDNILKFKIQNIVWLKEQEFDWVINLDKSKEAIALTKGVKCNKKSGFTANRFGKCVPISNGAEKHKWLTGLRDDFVNLNTKSYLEEIFEICGFHFSGEKYVLDIDHIGEWESIDKYKKVVGLNTGCGKRWLTRLWPEKNWVELSRLLKSEGYEVILIGGPEEDNKNREISEKADVKYWGYFPLKKYCSLVNQCHIIISQVSMSAHIALALNKRIILMNNIFNRKEFYLYGNGEIVEPDLDCVGCYKPRQDEKCLIKDCMESINVEIIYDKLKFLEVNPG